MPLSIRQAASIAHRWVGQQGNVPPGRFIMPKSYNTDKGARYFEVQYTIAGYTSPFLVMSFYVLDDGAVKVKKDRRDYIRKFMTDRGISENDRSGTPGLHHSEAVKIFFSAFEGVIIDRPKWFIKLWPRLDNGPQKPDAHAHIFVREENNLKNFEKKEIFVKIK